ESLSSLFAPFYRVGDDRDRTQGGTGLGLAITEKAIKRHGGKVEAVNSPGGGLMITITLAATACEELK
ncbi:MAG: ATP-binding protein, partial [Syntrophobacteraceae bacterium]